MITAIAVDDEPEAIEIINRHASKLTGLNIASYFYKPLDAIKYLRNTPVDLLFLDVNMPEVSGIEMLQQLKTLPLVVFTTAYEQYAIESFKFETIDYLLKPIDFDSFQNAVNKAKRAISLKLNSTNSETYIFIKDGTKTVKVTFNDIIVIKGCGNYVEFITGTDKFISRITISQLLNKLPDHKFIRVHNSYIVNIEQIDKIEFNHIDLGSHKISIGEGYRSVFFERIKNKMI